MIFSFFFNVPSTTEIYTLSLHDALPISHVLAEAVQALWPGTQVTIGPVIENGFYYDFFRNQPFSPEDRKSTRLNSSHTVISYAVFCLKKKKQNTTHM